MLEVINGVEVVERVKLAALEAVGRITQAQKISILLCQNYVPILKRIKMNLSSNYVIQ